MAERVRLTDLPDLCLLNTFGRIPLYDVIRNIRLVCPNFYRISKEQLRSRGTLALLEQDEYQLDIVRHEDNLASVMPLDIQNVRNDNGTPWQTFRTDQQINFNVLRLPADGLTEGFRALLIENLPNITHLTVVRHLIPSGPAFVELVRLLNHYAPMLISLILSFASIETNLREMSAPTLVETINGMESLRHLTLDVDLSRLFRRVTLPEPRLTILAQLEKFTCGIYGPTLTRSLREHANDHVRIAYDATFDAEDLLQFDRQLAHRFTRVTVRFHNIDDEMRLFCNQYSGLASVWMSFVELPIRTLSRCLSQLRQLVCLTLTISVVPQPEENQPPLEISPVPSVRCLKIEITTKSHHDTAQLHTAQLFPNVQVLILKQFPDECAECRYKFKHVYGVIRGKYGRIVRARIQECMRLSRQPFRACASVHTIKIIPLLGDLAGLMPFGFITIDQL